VAEKQTLDVFDNPNTEELLKRLGEDREIVLYGVVTEICVNFVARGLLDRGYRVSLVTDAVRHWDEAKGEATKLMVKRRGGRLVTTAEVIGENPA
jgi:nicotinamidase-related amidase